MTVRRRITAAERRARLAVRHGLVPACRTDDVVALTDDVVALHSTDPVTVYLSAAARMHRPSLAAVEAALYEDRSLIRHHAMRRTLWVFGHEAARLAHHAATRKLHGPQRRNLLALIEASAITDDPEAWVAKAYAEILALLVEGGPLGAREIGLRLPHLTVPVLVGSGRNTATQSAHSRVLLMMGFEGLVVRARPTGSWINGQYRWAAASEWFPGGFDGPAEAPLDERRAAAGLARRWLRAFGPGTRADLQWWAGWTATTTSRALADVGAVEVDLQSDTANGTGDGTGWVLPDDLEAPGHAEPWVALLPGLDPSTMGWKQRGWYLDPEHVPVLFDRNGNGGPTAWADGRIVGGWVQRRDGTIALRLLADVGRERRGALERAAGELEELLGEVRFSVRFPAPLQAELLR
ncbi:MAG TPA: winged helix DNA-binding domain-containing protein [Pseudonocardia sp.]|nr:winged helix DNA-binding domain-containing protein [Pseudonocardia sp.]